MRLDRTAPNRFAVDCSWFRLDEPLVASTRQLRHVLGSWSLRSLHDIELDAVTLGQRLEAVALDRGVMYETVLSIFGRDEAEAFPIIELLDGASSTHFQLHLM